VKYELPSTRARRSGPGRERFYSRSGLLTTPAFAAGRGGWYLLAVMPETRAPSRRPAGGGSSYRWKLPLLWVAIVAAYALMIVLTNPEIMIPIERQHEIYYGTMEVMCTGAWSMQAVEDGADRFHIHQRAVWLILDEGNDQDWEAPCVLE
jgi:hypothetical protein